jgi:hypothetical protein
MVDRVPLCLCCWEGGPGVPGGPGPLHGGLGSLGVPGPSPLDGEGQFKGHSIGGNAKATLGTLCVNPRGDLFSS